MRYRKLGGSALEVSVLGLGCSNFGRSVDSGTTREIVAAALDHGVRFFDTADCYGAHFAAGHDRGGSGTSETLLGEALRGVRDKAVVATKFGAPNFDMGFGESAGNRGGRAYMRRAVESSLLRLGTDYIDLYQIHFPDPATPIEETLLGLSELRDEGKIRHFGHSNFSVHEAAAAARAALELGCEGFVSAQLPWSLLDRAQEALAIKAAERDAVSVIAYFPLAQGLLTGKLRAGEEPPVGSRLSIARHLFDSGLVERMETVRQWADSNGRSLLEVSLGWLAAQPVCGAVIPGATSVAQMIANSSAVEWLPTEQELTAIGDAAGL